MYLLTLSVSLRDEKTLLNKECASEAHSIEFITIADRYELSVGIFFHRCFLLPVSD